MGSWYNSDGLYLKLGVTEATASKGGEYEDGAYGVQHYAEFTLNLASDMQAAGTDTFLSDTVVVPGGARVTKAEFYVETAGTSGGSATLEFGAIRTDRSTVYDADGFIAATAVASLTAGATIAGSGALVNTTLANDAYLTATVRTAAFTAGKVKVRIFWYMP